MNPGARRHTIVLRLLLALGILGTLIGPAAPVAPIEAAPPRDAAARDLPTNPLGGTELYGYLPYWQMSTSMADYLGGVPLTTIGLFSVTANRNGGLTKSQTGYQRITGTIGARLIADAHARGQRVELVFSTFGYAANQGRFLSEQLADLSGRRPDDAMAAVRRIGPAPPSWKRTAKELVGLASKLGLDGINVDGELINDASVDGYGQFLSALRLGLDAAQPNARLTVATMASPTGANLASVAIRAGADRVFLMGYDYHWSGSDPGGSAPIDRLDGGQDLGSSIAAYAAAGVPANRILLGLPLYGESWPVSSPDLHAAQIGSGSSWIPASHVALLTAPATVPFLAWPEITEFLSSADPNGGFRAIFYDSPRTLRPKLLLARTSGYAGAGFWAIGYERGLPGYLELMRDFRAGLVVPPPVVDRGGR
jgi:spore germination protein YaaH